MTEPLYHDQWLTIYQGDNRVVLADLPAASVHAVVTSPPYWGLRDYGTATWEGGDEACDHLERAGGTGRSTLGAESGGHAISDAGKVRSTERSFVPARSVCRKCGARRVDEQIGLEMSPQEYVQSLVDVFREVRRVLRDDGTVWLNLGDSYAAQRSGTTMPAETLAGGKNGWTEDGSRTNRDRHDGYSPSRNASAFGLKHKDLVGIPWRVALALQADGWYLRSDVIWSKPNPMPSSVTDRPTGSHEYIFLLAKKERYFYDADAIREPHTEVTLNRIKYGLKHKHPDNIGVAIPPVDTDEMGERFAHPGGRNKRTVWTVSTVPYPGAHYAVFPPKLIEPCIKASTSERGVCAECGAPWVRVIEETDEVRADFKGSRFDTGKTGERDGGDRTQPGERHVKVPVGWKASCAHEDGQTVPATILDPFAGSGTAGFVAQSLSRRAVLIDLNAEYLSQQLKRNAQVPLGL